MQAFVNVQGTEYSVPQAALRRVRHQLCATPGPERGQQSTGLLQRLNIDPSKWLTDLKNEGTEDVEGTNTIHISGKANVPQIVDDLKTIAQTCRQRGRERRPRPAQPAQRRHPVRRRRRQLGPERQATAQVSGQLRPEAAGGHARSARLAHPRRAAQPRRRQQARRRSRRRRTRSRSRTSCSQLGINRPPRQRAPRRPGDQRRAARVRRLDHGPEQLGRPGLRAVPLAGVGQRGAATVRQAARPVAA